MPEGDVIIFVEDGTIVVLHDFGDLVGFVGVVGRVRLS
jgi:hypothetical protein